MFEKNNQLSGKEFLFKHLEANDPSYDTANFESIPLNPSDITRICQILKSNTHIKVLRLINCQIRETDIQQIAEAIEKNHTLTEVEIEKFKSDSKETHELINKIKELVNRNRDATNANFKQ